MDSVKLAVKAPSCGGSRWKRTSSMPGAFFLREAATAPCYRLWSINDNNPAMLRVDSADPQAVSVAVEVWQVPAAGARLGTHERARGPLGRQGHAL